MSRLDPDVTALREAATAANSILTELIGNRPCENTPEVWGRAKAAYLKLEALLRSEPKEGQE